MTVIVNGTEVDFGDCCAVIENGSTLVPARALFETLGAQVSWNGETQTVYAERDWRLISFKIGDSKIYVDGQVKELGLSVKIIDSVAYIPLRSMCDALDYKLSWDEETKSAEVSYASF